MKKILFQKKKIAEIKLKFSTLKKNKIYKVKHPLKHM